MSSRGGRFSAEFKVEYAHRGINFDHASSAVARELTFGVTLLKCLDSSGVIFARLVSQDVLLTTMRTGQLVSIENGFCVGAPIRSLVGKKRIRAVIVGAIPMLIVA